jgi:hypothetical protein
MEELRHESRVCQIIDFGVCSEGYVIATAWYRMSLKTWRSKQPKALTAEQLPLYMSIGAKLIDATCRLEEHNVVHYDLKVSFKIVSVCCERTWPRERAQVRYNFQEYSDGRFVDIRSRSAYCTVITYL